MRAERIQIKSDELTLVCIGDTHLGAEGNILNIGPYELETNIIVNFNSILDEYKKRFKNPKFILLGDLVDMTLKQSVGDVYEQLLTPQEQIDILVQILARYSKDIIGIVQGNHERRAKKEAGLDPVQTMCKTLKIPYSTSILVVNIESEKGWDITIAASHGVAGGRGKASSVRQTEYFEKVITNADIYITGHTHVPNVTGASTFYIENGELKQRHSKLVTVGSFLAHAEYGMQKLLQPTSPLIPVVKVKHKNNIKKIEVTLTESEKIQMLTELALKQVLKEAQAC